LDRKSFDLLLYLIDHRDRAASKDELLQSLWPDQFAESETGQPWPATTAQDAEILGVCREGMRPRKQRPEHRGIR